MKFRQITRLVFYRWKIVTVFVGLGLVAGILLALLQPSVYTATALLRITFTINNPVETPPDWESRDVIFSSVQEAMSSDSALRAIAKKNGLDGRDLDALRKSIILDTLNTTEHLEIKVTAPSAQQAINLANDVANYARQSANQRWLDDLASITGQDESQLQLAQQHLDQARQKYTQANQKYNDLISQEQQATKDKHDQQVADINARIQAAQANYDKAASTIPKDNNAIDLAKNKLTQAQQELDNLQQAEAKVVDPDILTALDKRRRQEAGLEDATTGQQVAAAQVQELQDKVRFDKSLVQFPDLHSGSVTIVDPAKFAEQKADLYPLFIALAVLLGPVLGCVLVVVITRLDRRLPGFKTTSQIYEQPVIGSLPVFTTGDKVTKSSWNLKFWSKKPQAKLAATTPEELSPAAREKFRLLALALVKRHREELSLLAESRKIATATTGSSVATAVEAVPAAPVAWALRLQITSHAPATGKTTLVSNLGRELAELGYRTLLVDCDRRHPALPASFGVGPTEPGVPAKADTTQVQHTAYTDLDLLAYSTLPLRKNGLINQPELGAMLEKLDGQYDVILCDTPALGVTADVLALVPNVTRVLYLVDGSRPRIGADLERLRSLKRANAEIEGLVINRVSGKPTFESVI